MARATRWTGVAGGVGVRSSATGGGAGGLPAGSGVAHREENGPPGFQGEWDVISFQHVFSKINAKDHQVQTLEYQATGSLPIVDQGKAAVVCFSDREDKCFHCPQGW